VRLPALLLKTQGPTVIKLARAERGTNTKQLVLSNGPQRHAEPPIKWTGWDHVDLVDRVTPVHVHYVHSVYYVHCVHRPKFPLAHGVDGIDGVVGVRIL
jgi:hypothetical protein